MYVRKQHPLGSFSICRLKKSFYHHLTAEFGFVCSNCAGSCERKADTTATDSGFAAVSQRRLTAHCIRLSERELKVASDKHQRKQKQYKYN